MDRIEAMRLFVGVAAHQSFTEAARRAGVTPAQVSKKVAALEAHLGVRLLDRTTRSVRLTDAGRAYLDGARSVIGEIDALEEGVRCDQAALAGVLRVTAPVSFGARRLTPVILDFMAANPAVEVRLSLNDRMVDLVEEGMDVAVRIGRLADSSLIARRLAPMRLRLVGGAEQAGRIAHPRDLTSVACVIDTNMPAPHLWRFSRAGERVEARVEGRLHVNSPDAAAQAAAAGYGVALTPDFVAEPWLANGQLAELLPDWETEGRDIWAVFPQNRFLARRVRVFVDQLATVFARVDEASAASP